jgi:hypothetical protein
MTQDNYLGALAPTDCRRCRAVHGQAAQRLNCLVDVSPPLVAIAGRVLLHRARV